MAENLSVSDYNLPSNLDVQGGVALGVSLLSAVPGDAPGMVKEPATLVRSSVVALQQSWAQRVAQKRPLVRPVDARVDKAWIALHGALSASADLPPSQAKSQAAERLLALLFADGLRFTQLKVNKQWAECERRLQLIDASGLEPDLMLAAGGPEFLEEIRAAHQAYGQTLGITAPGDTEPDVNLMNHLRDLRQSIADYALQVVAWSRQEKSAQLLAAQRALAPIAAARDAQIRITSGAATDDGPVPPPPPPAVTPETPVPEVP